MSKTISDQIMVIIGNSKTRELPDMIFMSREEAERMAKKAGIKLEALNLQFLDDKTEQSTVETSDE